MVETMTIKIIAKLKSLIESITIAQGVEFNMSGKVHVNALSFSEDDNLDAIQTPFVSILQNAREPFKTKDSVDQGQGSMVVFPLTIEAVMTNLTPDDWKEAEIFKAEVKRLIREAVVTKDANGNRNLLGLGKSITEVKISLGSVLPSEEHSAYQKVRVPIEISFHEDMLNPFS